MKNFYKSALLAGLVMFFSLAGISNAQQTDSAVDGSNNVVSSQTESVNYFDSVINVNTDSSIDVHELIVYNFGSNVKHGIFRYVPVAYKNSLANFRAAISNVSVLDENGKSYPYTTSFSNSNWEVKIGDPNLTLTGTKIYNIRYTVRGAIGFFKDHDELYWNGTGNGWQVPILRATVEVRGPSGPNDKFDAACYSGLVNSTAPCQHITKKGFFTEFDQDNLNPGEGLTVVVGFAKGLIQEPTFWQKLRELVLDNWIAFLPILTLLVMYLLWHRKGRDPKVASTIIAQYEAPDNLTPAQVAEIVKFKEPPVGITAEIIALAVAGFLQINKDGDDYKLVQLKPANETLVSFQTGLLNGLFSEHTQSLKNQPSNGLPTVWLADLRDNFYLTLNKAYDQISKSLVDQGYFDANPTSVRSIYIILGVFFLFFGIIFVSSQGWFWFFCCALSSLIIWLFGMVMPRRTEKGAEALNKIVGLRLYLNVAEGARMNFSGAPTKTPAHFEKLLPYAIALGVERQWAKQFEEIYVKPPKWYKDSNSTFNTIVFISSLQNFHSVSSSSLASRPASAASGGSGFSGGSGGGFGGGGGGSW